VSGSLAERLALLSRQAGSPVAAEPAIARQLQRLATGTAALVRGTDDALARQLGGRVRAPGLVEIEYRHPLCAPHGRCRLDLLAAPDLDWLDGPPAAGRRRGELVFIDTETTGLSGGTGTLAFLVGIARVRGPALVVTQWLMTRFSSEAALLEALLGALVATSASAQGRRIDAAPVELVSYNGKSFDLPLLATRLKLARMPPALADYRHHDLLHPLRTAFGRIWPDCRLQTAEQRLIGIARDDDLPGHRIPSVWASFVQSGDTRELGALVQHNRIDLLSLAALLPTLRHVYLGPAAATAASLPDTDASATQATPDSASIARMQRRHRRDDCARTHLLARLPTLDRRALSELADLHRSRREWALAVPIWMSLARDGSLQATEALARYHEHVTRDIAEAILWCERLCHEQPGTPAHERRLHRLQTRLQRRHLRQAQARSGSLFGAT
jgi:uncharacterized protein YprB with RNaseH-like and TPR domain